jgi:hypothetical protein
MKANHPQRKRQNPKVKWKRSPKPKQVTFTREVLVRDGASPTRVFIDAVQDARNVVARGGTSQTDAALAAQGALELVETPPRITRKTKRMIAADRLAGETDPMHVYDPAGIIDLGLEKVADGRWRRRWLIFGHALI